MMRSIIGLIILVTVSAAGENRTTVYDSSLAPLLPEQDVRVELHQRVEGEERPPITKPEFELMNQPCLGWQFQAACSVYNADSGRELFLVTSPAEIGGASLLAIAADNHAAYNARIPDAAGVWAISPMKHDRIALGSYYDGVIHIFDLEQWEYTHAIDIPGEAYVWNLVEGGDGRLYGGTFPGGKLIALDQDTLEIEDLGQVRAPNRFVHQVSALPDGRLLCRVGTEQPGTWIYDPANQTVVDTPQSLDGITQGVIWESYFVTPSQIFDKALRPVTLPFSAPEEFAGPYRFETDLTSRHILFFSQDTALFRYESASEAPHKVYDFDLRGGTLMASAVTGGVYGVRGQQYFKIKPGDTALDRRGVGIASPPRVPAFLQMDSRNQVWGAPLSGLTVFFMDGDTGVFVSMGAVAPGHGRVEDVALVEQTAYGVAYPQGVIFVLDIEAPWNEWSGSNPRIIESLSSRGYSRPTGGIHTSAGNLLFSGWSSDGNTPGGAIAVTDAETERTRLVEDPFGEQAVTGLALNNEYLFVGTTTKADGQQDALQARPQFGVMGIDTLQPYWNHSFDDAVAVSRLSFNAYRNDVVMTVDDALRVFDVSAMRMRPPFEVVPPRVTSNGFAQRNDAHAYYGHENALVRVHLDTGAWETVLEMPDEIGAITAMSEGQIYLACGVHVYRVLFPESYPDLATAHEGAAGG